MNNSTCTHAQMRAPAHSLALSASGTGSNHYPPATTPSNIVLLASSDGGNSHRQHSEPAWSQSNGSSQSNAIELHTWNAEYNPKVSIMFSLFCVNAELPSFTIT